MITIIGSNNEIKKIVQQFNSDIEYIGHEPNEFENIYKTNSIVSVDIISLNGINLISSVQPFYIEEGLHRGEQYAYDNYIIFISNTIENQVDYSKIEGQIIKIGL